MIASVEWRRLVHLYNSEVTRLLRYPTTRDRLTVSVLVVQETVLLAPITIGRPAFLSDPVVRIAEYETDV